MAVWLVAAWFINPPYPFPFENNLAWTDFVRLEESAARQLESEHPAGPILTVWPLTDALRRPDFGFVSQRVPVEEMRGFEPERWARAANPGAVVLYCRMWDPRISVLRLPGVIPFISRYYDFAPQLTGSEIAVRFGLIKIARYSRRGQWIEIYVRRI